MKLFNFRKRNIEEPAQTANDVLLSAILSQDSISCEQALNIPAVARCVNLISETVSMIPIKLYREEITGGKRKTVEVTDSRCDLLNEDTKDTLDGAQFKKALVRDYLLIGNAYAYINKQKNSSAIFRRKIRKPPDISKTYGSTGSRQYKPQPS